MKFFDVRFIDNNLEMEKEFTITKIALIVACYSLPNFPLKLV